MPARNVARPAGRMNKKKRRPFMAASGISTDDASEYIHAFRNTFPAYIRCGQLYMSLSGVPSSLNIGGQNGHAS